MSVLATINAAASNSRRRLYSSEPSALHYLLRFQAHFLQESQMKLHTILPATIASLLFAGALTGCNKTVAYTGYIPRTVALKADGDDRKDFRKKDLDTSRFGKVVIEPVVTPDGNAYGDLTPDQLQQLRTLLQEALAKSFGTGIGTGDRTLVIRAAITGVKPNQPLRNIAPQSQILKGGYGYAGAELYAMDGANGPVVAALMQTHDTERIGTEKLSALGTAEKACTQWAESFRELVDKK
jgi:hypothetical protein